MKTDASRFRPGLVFESPVFIACALAAALAGCGGGEKPPSENDAKMAVQHYFLGQGLSEGRTLADNACSSQFDSVKGCSDRTEMSEWVGSVEGVARVTEIGPAREESVLTDRANRFGVSSWDTKNITVWPVRVELVLECICRDRSGRIEEVPARTHTATQQFKLRQYEYSKDWSVMR